MITKEEILRLACKMAGRSIAGGIYKRLENDPWGIDNEAKIHECFNAILHVAQKENIRIEDGPARKDPIYTPEIEAALQRKNRTARSATELDS